MDGSVLSDSGHGANNLDVKALSAEKATAYAQAVGEGMVSLAERQFVNARGDIAELGVEVCQAALCRQIEGVLRRRILAAGDAAGVAVLRRVGNGLRPGEGIQQRKAGVEAALQPRGEGVVVALRRMREVVDGAHRHRSAGHGERQLRLLRRRKC